VGGAASALGWTVDPFPLSDGGEGLLEVCDVAGSQLRTTTVIGPDGRGVEASWRIKGDVAIVEMARASGLSLVGGPGGNDPLQATSYGTGQLIAAAAAAVGSAGTVVVGLGGSATTDGGAGTIAAIEASGGLKGATLVGACDVRIGFVEAARLFAPQKGATVPQVAVLEARLRGLVHRYESEFGVDVADLPGAGAAGGLGGAIAVLGGELRSGYELVAEFLGLREALVGAQQVITGEGSFDTSSFAGKVVGGVVDDASALGIATLVIAGRVTDDALKEAEARTAEVVSLSERFGEHRALTETLNCIGAAATEALGRFDPGQTATRGAGRLPGGRGRTPGAPA
jgi:glycerate kinase